MVCATSAMSILDSPLGDVETFGGLAHRLNWEQGERPVDQRDGEARGPFESAEGGNDPFDDFEDDDFDDEFDDDFEEDWEDDLTEDDEFPDTFGGAEPEEEEVAEPEDSPFADDPDFDDA